MRDGIGIVLMESEDGELIIQLFDGTEKASESFDNLAKLSDGDSGRVTFIKLDYKGNKIFGKAKNLPVVGVPRDEQPDGIVLGEGPLWLDKNKEDEDGKEGS